jgi:hypothetical protein
MKRKQIQNEVDGREHLFTSKGDQNPPKKSSKGILGKDLRGEREGDAPWLLLGRGVSKW